MKPDVPRRNIRAGGRVEKVEPGKISSAAALQF
jgi:hypothetical protein